MKTKSILLLVLIANAMAQVFVYLFICACLHSCNDPGISVFLYLCICVFLILAMIQARPKHFLVETEDKNVADNAVEPPVDFGTKSGQTVSGRSLCWANTPDCVGPDWWATTRSPEYWW